MNPTRRSVLAGLATLAVVPVVAACGSDSPRSASPASDGPKGGAEEGAFPVTITHKYGETKVEAAPERVVCVGLTDQDTLLALGIVPVGVSYWFGEKSKRGIYTWAEEAFGDAEPPTLLMNTNGVEIERIQSSPDVSSVVIGDKDKVWIGLSNPGAFPKPEPYSRNWVYRDLKVEFFN